MCTGVPSRDESALDGAPIRPAVADAFARSEKLKS
jgi:hypothetical protein